jgi:hypothetical protein
MAAGSRFAAAWLAASAVVVAGCGGGHGSSTTTTTLADRQAVPQRSQLDPPLGVPDRATGAARPEARRVINAWLSALRHGHVERAAHYFALPSKFQNATPVLTVHTEAERIAVNLSLPCGAKARAMGGAGAYTIVSFLLTKRPGADCGSGVGGTARGAIRVERRHITEWYRLPDHPSSADDDGPAT